ncbi:Hypothetical protein F53441_1297 [Fusarium austroafricanum]|uniref:Zn(2)-C6 fungal-type domain-containing protein n=1 Tax=Fusarium austroafricanum TaxID=2364996 RepID=A0A8H4KVX6_9HYPO|nr:Hypothetical protein F53441_1297 [Fusarium austroafricanum]
METHNFHPIHRLPLELGFQIWAAACVSHHRNRCGVHYIDIDGNNGNLLPLDFDHSTVDRANQVNSSAYLIDGGLWSACQESKDVMIRHLNSHQDGEEQPIPFGSDNQGCFRVYPTRDIFCVKARSWKSLQEDSLVINVAIGYGTQNIAFEYDSSWNIDLPGYYYDLFEEDSARGVLSRILYNYFINNCEQPTLWIIDKTAEWAGHGREYIQVSWINICLRNTDDPSMSYSQFKDKLDLGSDCEFDHPNFDWYGHEMDPGIYEMLKITEPLNLLVRRDNEVKFCPYLGYDCERVSRAVHSNGYGNEDKGGDDDYEASECSTPSPQPGKYSQHQPYFMPGLRILPLTSSPFIVNKMTSAERKRKFHKRSRTGCTTCKQRRIRCDEERPKCRNCASAFQGCVYESAKPPLRERKALRQPGEQLPWAIDRNTSPVAVAAIESTALTPCLSKKTLGPLYNFPIEMPLESKHLLNYFSQVASVSKSTSPSSSGSGLRNILIIAAFQHAWRFGDLGVFEQTFLYHKCQTVALVNAHLRPSQFVPFCAQHIITLCFSEFTFGNFDAAETHIKGMMLYLESRDPEPKDEHQAIIHELCDRYFVLAYNMVQGVKSRVDDYLASPVGARDGSQSNPSAQELEQLVPKLHSHEAGGPGLCFDTMSLLPSFFSSSALPEKLHPVDAGSILACIREITHLFDIRRSPQPTDQDEKSPYKLWDQGGPSRLFGAVVNAHIASSSPMPDGSPPDLKSSWIVMKTYRGAFQIQCRTASKLKNFGFGNCS